MTTPQIDHKLVGVAVAFDAETGDVLHIYEKFVETLDGKPGCKAELTTEECEEARARAAQIYPRRRVDVIAGPPDMISTDTEEAAPVRYRVDPMTRQLRVEPECDPRAMADLFSGRYRT